MSGTAARILLGVTEHLMLGWYEAKMFLEHASAITSDALHVLIGVGLWVVAAVVLRRRLTDWLPWLVVLAAIVFNETVDLWMEQWPDRAMQYGESAKDLLITLLLPTLLMVAARERPGLFVRQTPAEPDGKPPRP